MTWIPVILLYVYLWLFFQVLKITKTGTYFPYLIKVSLFWGDVTKNKTMQLKMWHNVYIYIINILTHEVVHVFSFVGLLNEHECL